MLERAKLVTRRREGREHILAFDPAPLDAASAWIDAQKAAWTFRLKALDQLLTQEDAT